MVGLKSLRLDFCTSIAPIVTKQECRSITVIIWLSIIQVRQSVNFASAAVFVKEASEVQFVEHWHEKLEV